MKNTKYPRSILQNAIDINDYEKGTRTDFFRPLFQMATGNGMKVPFIVARGSQPGPTLGVSAVVHGNELNGIRIIHAILADLNLEELAGTLLCVPVVNVAAYNLGQRYFIDGIDLNRAFPGKKDGKPSEQFAYSFSRTFLPALDYLVDIHTAAQGRLNTFYVRADMETPTTREMAMALNPQIVLGNSGGDDTLRRTAMRKGIPAVTLEAGNPSVIQGKMVDNGEAGVRNVMVKLGMLKGEVIIGKEPRICSSSKWISTSGGGLLHLHVSLGQVVEKGQKLASLIDLFGAKIKEFPAPRPGVVIGLNANPVAIPGTKFCHLGKLV